MAVSRAKDAEDTCESHLVLELETVQAMRNDAWAMLVELDAEANKYDELISGSSPQNNNKILNL